MFFTFKNCKLLFNNKLIKFSQKTINEHMDQYNTITHNGALQLQGAPSGVMNTDQVKDLHLAAQHFRHQMPGKENNQAHSQASINEAA